MTTWATLRAKVRRQLNDTGATPRWSNDLLLDYAVRAVEAYSEFFPLASTATPTAGDTAGQYIVDEEWEITGVSHETAADYEEFLEPLARGPGTAMHVYAEGYWQDGVTIYVTPTTLEDVKVAYTTCHTRPTTDNSVLTIPLKDEGLIEFHIYGMAMDSYVGRSALLDRWKEKGSRSDNPVIIASWNWKKEWSAQIGQRLSGRSVHLYKRGRDRPETYDG